MPLSRKPPGAPSSRTLPPMLTLHHAPRSRSARIVWLLEELGEPYELALTTIQRQDGSGAADPTNPHPDKKVPALVHDGAVITESGAICLYLTDAFPKAGVGPLPGDPARGAYLTWLFYYQGVIEPSITAKFAGLAEHPAIRRSYGREEGVNERILAALSAGPYILGERFSSVDVLIGSMGHFARAMLPADPIIDTYLQRLGQRPAGARARARDAT
jgi:glutathione S-transferase